MKTKEEPDPSEGTKHGRSIARALILIEDVLTNAPSEEAEEWLWLFIGTQLEQARERASIVRLHSKPKIN